MKPAKLRKIKAARLKEGQSILMEAGDLIVKNNVLRVVQAKEKRNGDEKQRPSHLMTITTREKRFRVLPTADLYVVDDREG